MILGKTISIMALIMLLSACGPQTDGSDSSNDDSEDDGSGSGEIATETVSGAEGGTVSVASGEIAGTELVIPAGALNVDTNITVEEGSSLVTDTLSDDLELGDDNTVASAGPSVVIEADQLVDATQPLTLAISLDPSFALQQNQNLAVLYIVKKASESGQTYIGLITDVTKADGKLTFSTTHFGAFQAVALAQPVTAIVEKKTTKAIGKKRNATEAEGLWVSGCIDESERQPDGTLDERSGIERLHISGNNVSVRMQEFSGTTCDRTMISAAFSVKATMVIGADYAAIPGAKELDLTVEDFSIIPPTLRIAEEWNRNEFCGITDWKVGEPRTMTDDCQFGPQDEGSDPNGDPTGADADQTAENAAGLNLTQDTDADGTISAEEEAAQDECDDSSSGPPSKGTVLYTVYKIEGDALTLGLEEKRDTCEFWGDTPTNRPVELEPDSFQRKLL